MEILTINYKTNLIKQIHKASLWEKEIINFSKLQPQHQQALTHQEKNKQTQ
jgi:hypothetical protein